MSKETFSTLAAHHGLKGKARPSSSRRSRGMPQEAIDRNIQADIDALADSVPVGHWGDVKNVLTWLRGNEMSMIANFFVDSLKGGRFQSFYIDDRVSGKPVSSAFSQGPVTKRMVNLSVHSLMDATRVGAPAGGAARELFLWANNDGQLFEQMTKHVVAQLERKLAAGTYDREKSVLAWKHWADEAAKRYSKGELGSGKWNVVFPPDVRLETARTMRDHFEASHR